MARNERSGWPEYAALPTLRPGSSRTSGRDESQSAVAFALMRALLKSSAAQVAGLVLGWNACHHRGIQNGHP